MRKVTKKFEHTYRTAICAHTSTKSTYRAERYNLATGERNESWLPAGWLPVATQPPPALCVARRASIQMQSTQFAHAHAHTHTHTHSYTHAARQCVAFAGTHTHTHSSTRKYTFYICAQNARDMRAHIHRAHTHTRSSTNRARSRSLSSLARARKPRLNFKHSAAFATNDDDAH